MRADFQPDYPLIVIRVEDEENCAYLPGREAIAGHGIDPAKQVPYAIVEAKASPHRTNKQKVLIENLTIIDEE